MQFEQMVRARGLSLNAGIILAIEGAIRADDGSERPVRK